jgi:hypothetical protein
MKNSTRILAVVLTVGLTVLGIGTSASAEDDVCRWGGDNGQSLKCFDCQKLVQVGHEWRWVNTCGSHVYSSFSWAERN